MARPKIVVLCGSTRFIWLWEEAAILESADGKIVLTANINFKNQYHNMVLQECGFKNTDDVKRSADELHLRKIDLADEVLVLNQDGYIGDSTSREIEYARQHGKVLRYWESEHRAGKKLSPDWAIVRAAYKYPDGKVIKDVKDTL
jgi:hypothetical protein